MIKKKALDIYRMGVYNLIYPMGVFFGRKEFADGKRMLFVS